jgi:alpha-tubulin suppressor-like RCC1 family protein
LALKADGTVWAWGYNSNGQTGDNRAGSITTVPVEVSALSRAMAIAAGGAHSLAVKSDGTVWAWGSNQYGQLGNGSNEDSSAPVQVPGLVNVIRVAGGDHYSLALKSDGTVWAWGINREGELGNGTNTETNVPVWVSGLSGVIAISAAPAVGPNHSLALKADGTVWAWGYNASSQLGNGGNTDSNVPIQVPGIRGAIAIAAGGAHSVAILATPEGRAR